jgi:hypothetical protein
MTRELPERFRRLITLVAPSLPRIATGSSHFHSLRPEGFRWHAAYAETLEVEEANPPPVFHGVPVLDLFPARRLLNAPRSQSASDSQHQSGVDD